MNRTALIVAVAALVLTSCYSSGTVEGPPDLCASACALSAECGGLDAEQCLIDCDALPMEGMALVCTVALDDLYVCLVTAGCDATEVYQRAVPFSGDDYPCRAEDETAMGLDCVRR